MKIKIMTYQSLETLKRNLSSDIEKYGEDSPEELLSGLGKYPLVDTGINCSPLRLKASTDEKDDFENVKRLYGTLKDISPAMASDERLWAGLAMGKNCWQYLSARWKKAGWNENTVLDHFFFAHSGRRSLTRNGLARLWWIGYLTYDEKGADPWHYTKFACTYQRFIVDVLERNTGNSKALIKACVDACEMYALEHPEDSVNSNMMRDLQNFMSILGGTYLIDMMDPGTLFEKIFEKIKALKNAGSSTSQSVNAAG